jgi:hypothetical protein
VTGRERTLQQRDPLAALVGRPLSYFAGVGVPVYAAGMTWANRHGIDSPGLAAVAVLLVVLAGASLVLLSGPLRAPFTAGGLTFIVSLTLLALVASALSMGTGDAAIRDDWGGPAVGLFILALAPYRPAKDLAVAGVLSTILVGVVALVQAEHFVAALPPIAFVVVATTPILALSLAGAAFAHVLVRGLDRWSTRSRKAMSAIAAQSGVYIARSVQQDNVTILNQEVVPFLEELRAGGVVTEQTRQRARAIADSVRSTMVAGAGRSWLDDALDDGAVRGGRLDDPDRLARWMSADERTAVRALIVALQGRPAASAEHSATTVEIRREGERCAVVLRAGDPGGARGSRSRLAPFLAVLRVMFTDLHVERDSEALTLRFSYEQR